MARASPRSAPPQTARRFTFFLCGAAARSATAIRSLSIGARISPRSTCTGRRTGGSAPSRPPEPGGLSLRIAPADGSAPLDGSGPGAIIRRGAPLYFDWVGADRLLVHVGSGASGFVGEVDVDGAAIAPAVAGTGDFRAASVSRAGQYLAYVRSDAGLA